MIYVPHFISQNNYKFNKGHKNLPDFIIFLLQPFDLLEYY